MTDVYLEKQERCPKCLNEETWIKDIQFCRYCGFNGSYILRIEQKIKEARQAALEEAAKVAEQTGRQYRTNRCQAVAETAARKIRALMEEPAARRDEG